MAAAAVDVGVTLGLEFTEHTRTNHLHREGLVQMLRLHEAEALAAREYHRQSVHMSNKQHERALIQERYEHEEALDIEKRLATRENIRDDWQQIATQSEMVMLVNTLVLAVAFAMLIEGHLPESCTLAAPVLMVAYLCSISCSVCLLLSSVRFAMTLRFRVGQTIVQEIREAIDRTQKMDQQFRKVYAQATRPSSAPAACDIANQRARLTQPFSDQILEGLEEPSAAEAIHSRGTVASVLQKLGLTAKPDASIALPAALPALMGQHDAAASPDTDAAEDTDAADCEGGQHVQAGLLSIAARDGKHFQQCPESLQRVTGHADANASEPGSGEDALACTPLVTVNRESLLPTDASSHSQHNLESQQSTVRETHQFTKEFVSGCGALDRSFLYAVQDAPDYLCPAKGQQNATGKVHPIANRSQGSQDTWADHAAVASEDGRPFQSWCWENTASGGSQGIAAGASLDASTLPAKSTSRHAFVDDVPEGYNSLQWVTLGTGCSARHVLCNLNSTLAQLRSVYVQDEVFYSPRSEATVESQLQPEACIEGCVSTSSKPQMSFSGETARSLQTSVANGCDQSSGAAEGNTEALIGQCIASSAHDIQWPSTCSITDGLLRRSPRLVSSNAPADADPKLSIPVHYTGGSHARASSKQSLGNIDKRQLVAVTCDDVEVVLADAQFQTPCDAATKFDVETHDPYEDRYTTVWKERHEYNKNELSKFQELQQIKCHPWEQAATELLFAGTLALLIAACLLVSGSYYVQQIPLPLGETGFPAAPWAAWAFTAPCLMTAAFLCYLELTLQSLRDEHRAQREERRVKRRKFARYASASASGYNLDTDGAGINGTDEVDVEIAGGELDDSPRMDRVSTDSPTVKGASMRSLRSCDSLLPNIPLSTLRALFGFEADFAALPIARCMVVSLFLTLPLFTIMCAVDTGSQTLQGVSTSLPESFRPHLLVAEHIHTAPGVHWPPFWQPLGAAWLAETHTLLVLGSGESLLANVGEDAASGQAVISALSPFQGMSSAGVVPFVDVCSAAVRDDNSTWFAAVGEDLSVHVSRGYPGEMLGRWQMSGAPAFGGSLPDNPVRPRHPVLACRSGHNARGSMLELWMSDNEQAWPVLSAVQMNLRALDGNVTRLPGLNPIMHWPSKWLLADSTARAVLQNPSTRPATIVIESVDLTPDGGLFVLITKATAQMRRQLLASVSSTGTVRQCWALAAPQAAGTHWVALTSVASLEGKSFMKGRTVGRVFLVASGPAPLVAVLHLDEKYF